MKIQWNKNYLDLENLLHLSRGDNNQIMKYLNQFLELIPTRVESLKKNMEEGNRKMIRQILHQMSPQLQFFGIPEVIIPIRKLEHEYETIAMEDLKSLVNEILMKLDHATKEVTLILKKHF
jgi:hypothetical protein